MEYKLDQYHYQELTKLKKTLVNIVGWMDHAPIIARVAIASLMVTNINSNSMTRWVEAHITKNYGVGWKNKSKLHQNE